jgi:hypothetical protein
MKSDPSWLCNGLFDHLLQDARDNFDIVVVKLHCFSQLSYLSLSR